MSGEIIADDIYPKNSLASDRSSTSIKKKFSVNRKQSVAVTSLDRKIRGYRNLQQESHVNRLKFLQETIAYGSNNITVNLRFRQIASQFQKLTRFNFTEICVLLRIYYAICKTKGTVMTLSLFRDVMYNFFECTDSVIIENVFKVWDTKGNLIISMEEWVGALDIYLRGTLDERIDFTFHVFNDQQSHGIKKETIAQYTQNFIVSFAVKEDKDDFNKEMVAMILQQLDVDKDGIVSRKDFQAAVHKKPILLEVLGSFLPSYETARSLEVLFQIPSRLEKKRNRKRQSNCQANYKY